VAPAPQIHREMCYANTLKRLGWMQVVLPLSILVAMVAVLALGLAIWVVFLKKRNSRQLKVQ
jgi:hypothetical protein